MREVTHQMTVIRSSRPKLSRVDASCVISLLRRLRYALLTSPTVLTLLPSFKSSNITSLLLLLLANPITPHTQ